MQQSGIDLHFPLNFCFHYVGLWICSLEVSSNSHFSSFIGGRVSGRCKRTAAQGQPGAAYDLMISMICDQTYRSIVSQHLF